MPTGPVDRRGKSRKIIITTRRVVVFLIAGAIVNVAVAWGCSLVPLEKSQREVDPSEIRFLMARQTAVDWSKHNVIDAVGKRHIGYERIEVYDDGPFLVLVFAGWPCRGLYEEMALAPPYPMSWFTKPTPLPQRLNANRGGAFLSFMNPNAPVAVPDSKVLPVFSSRLNYPQIIWPGFAINTLFYAAILWLLFAGTGRIRRWRRIKRGLCPACTYPVGSSEVCTECGNRVKGAPT